MKFIPFIIFNLISIKLCLQELDITDEDGVKTVLICYSNEKQCFNQILDINSPFTWVASKDNPNPFILKKFEEKTYGVNIISSNVILQYEKGKKIQGKHLQSTIYVSRKTIYTFPYITAYNSSDFGNITGVFGLGYPYSNISKTYSMFQNLYKFGYIKQRIFSIVFEKYKRGNLYLGQIHRDVPIEKYSNCSLDLETIQNRNGIVELKDYYLESIFSVIKK